MDVDLIEAMWRLEGFPPDELPDVAARALEEGYDGPALRALAGLRLPTREQVGELFDGALREMDRTPLSRMEAGMVVARDVAGKISRGELNPMEGANRIVRDVWDRCRELEGLKRFVTLVEEQGRHPEHREVVEEGIVREARRLLA